MWEPKHPIREVLMALCGGAAPPLFVQGWDLSELDDRQTLELQDWCALHAKPEWVTGISVMDAAELLVQGAIDNNNIEKP